MEKCSMHVVSRHGQAKEGFLAPRLHFFGATLAQSLWYRSQFLALARGTKLSALWPRCGRITALCYGCYILQHRGKAAITALQHHGKVAWTWVGASKEQTKTTCFCPINGHHVKHLMDMHIHARGTLAQRDYLHFMTFTHMHEEHLHKEIIYTS